MTDMPRTIIYEDGEVLLDTADPTTYVTLGDEGLPATFLDLDAQEALGIAPEPMTARRGPTTCSRRSTEPEGQPRRGCGLSGRPRRGADHHHQVRRGSPPRAGPLHHPARRARRPPASCMTAPLEPRGARGESCVVLAGPALR